MVVNLSSMMMTVACTVFDVWDKRQARQQSSVLSSRVSVAWAGRSALCLRHSYTRILITVVTRMDQ